MLGRKRQKEAASAGLKMKGTRARLEVTVFSWSISSCPDQEGGTVLDDNSVFTRYIRTEGL